MENKTTSFKSIVYTNGLLLGGVSILILVLMYVLNLGQEWYLSVISTGITIYLIASGITALKKSQGGFISLGQSIKTGLAIAAIAGIIGAVYAYIHYAYVYPEFIEMTLDESRNQMIEGGMTDAQIEAQMGVAEMMATPFIYATISLVGSIFIGFIISLITGLVVKKEDPYAQQ